MANPGQDGDAENDPTQNSELEVAQNEEEREVEVEEIQAIEEEGESAGRTDSLDNVTVTGFRPNGDLELQRKPAGVAYQGKVQNVGGREINSDLEAQWPPGSSGTGLSSSETSADAYIREKRRLRHTGGVR